MASVLWRRCVTRWVLCVGLVGVTGGSGWWGAQAQWVTQRIPLRPGWNAIQLEVTPADPVCDRLMSSLPGVRGVWQFSRRFTTAEYTTNPQEVMAKSDHWLVWLPKMDPDHGVRSLERLAGGQAYLVRLDQNVAPIVWEVKGIPALPRSSWIPNSLNLTGVPVGADQPPTFFQFFRDSPVVEVAPGAGSGLFEIGPDGKEIQVRQTARLSVEPGRAYWVRIGPEVGKTLPLQVGGDVVASGALDYGREGSELSLELRNLTGVPTRVVLTPRASEPAPSGMPAVAGEVPLAYFRTGTAAGAFGWTAWSGPLALELGAGGRQELRVAVRRSAMKSGSLEGEEAVSQSLIEVTETPHGMRVVVPVRAEAGPPTGAGLASPGEGGLPTYHPQQGLWVGKAIITRVSRCTAEPGETAATPLPVGASLSYRVLLHVDESGVARLLQRVLIAVEAGDTNRTPRLYSDDVKVPANAALVARLSSVAFPMIDPLALSGRFGYLLEGAVDLGHDDPVNPFKHRYHPDHDNLDERFGTNRLAAGRESFAVKRDLRFLFQVTQQTEDGRYLPPRAVLALSGEGQHVVMDPLPFGGDFTLMAWVRAEGPGGRALPIFDLGNGADDNVRLGIESPSGCVAFTVARGTRVAQLVTTNTFPAETWVHVAAAVDSTGMGSIYWNGELAARGSLDLPVQTTRTNCFVGRSSGSSPEFFQGCLYDLAVFDTARSAEEVAEDMRLAFTEGDTVAYFMANEGQGTLLVDADGSGRTARLVGVTWDASEVPETPFWGLGEVYGVYEETLRGLRTQPIATRGVFALQRLNTDSKLR